jgi:hypothetical protein
MFAIPQKNATTVLVDISAKKLSFEENEKKISNEG